MIIEEYLRRFVQTFAPLVAASNGNIAFGVDTKDTCKDGS